LLKLVYVDRVSWSTPPDKPPSSLGFESKKVPSRLAFNRALSDRSEGVRDTVTRLLALDATVIPSLCSWCGIDARPGEWWRGSPVPLLSWKDSWWNSVALSSGMVSRSEVGCWPLLAALRLPLPPSRDEPPEARDPPSPDPPPRALLLVVFLLPSQLPADMLW
jgi:hypothetical protein